MLKLFHKLLKPTPGKRFIASSGSCLHRVTIIGSAGGIGKALVMLLKTNPLVTDIVLMDIQNTAGIAADIGHIDTFSGVKSFTGVDKMEQSLECSDLVVVCAGAARSAKTTREGLFEFNKELIYQVALLKAKVCPEAFLAIITNPINALTPLAAETLKQANAYDPKKLFGITKLDTMRARTFIGEYLNVDPYKVKVKVIGGHSTNTIVPALSSASPTVSGDLEDLKVIYDKIKNAGSEVLKAKGGKETAQLSIAFVAAKFCDSILKALDGKSGIIDVAYVESKLVPEVSFFSSNFEIKKEGIKKFQTLPDLSNYEKELLKKAIPEIKKSIEQGVQYAKSMKNKK